MLIAYLWPECFVKIGKILADKANYLSSFATSETTMKKNILHHFHHFKGRGPTHSENLLWPKMTENAENLLLKLNENAENLLLHLYLIYSS